MYCEIWNKIIWFVQRNVQIGKKPYKISYHRRYNIIKHSAHQSENTYHPLHLLSLYSCDKQINQLSLSFSQRQLLSLKTLSRFSLKTLSHFSLKTLSRSSRSSFWRRTGLVNSRILTAQLQVITMLTLLTESLLHFSHNQGSNSPIFWKFKKSESDHFRIVVPFKKSSRKPHPRMTFSLRSGIQIVCFISFHFMFHLINDLIDHIIIAPQPGKILTLSFFCSNLGHSHSLWMSELKKCGIFENVQKYVCMISWCSGEMSFEKRWSILKTSVKRCVAVVGERWVVIL